MFNKKLILVSQIFIIFSCSNINNIKLKNNEKSSFIFHKNVSLDGECTSCDGEGETRCPNCDSNTPILRDCRDCDGSGKVTCSRCDGSKYIRCKDCKGSGKVISGYPYYN